MALTAPTTILITGGSGDLGTSLTALLTQRGDLVRRLDPVPPPDGIGDHIPASILDRGELARAVAGADTVVHVAAWHGIHEGRGLRTPHEFWDVNMTGTANLLEAMARDNRARRLVFLSSTSVARADSFYGLTKRLGEQLVAWYAAHRGINAIILRPPSFIPPGNLDVYDGYAAWAREYWGRSAMHIEDLSRAVLMSADTLARESYPQPPILSLGARDDIPADERSAWDTRGPGTSFRRLFPGFYDAAIAAGFDVSRPPLARDVSEARRVMGFEPLHGIRDVLDGLTAGK
ncbi:MAG: NAD(P)-dependent oxidoreductase [Candidatus Sumerlaeaceae bacterium]|nr:NAD(P)-dependent oxidoreductase [Candidatus Sumerlaeaceae bacterium]